MCLSNIIGGLKTATEDIKVYKVLQTYKGVIKLPRNGVKFQGIIDDTEVNGKLSIQDKMVYLCTNDERYDGVEADNKHRYQYSWVLDDMVSSIKVGGKELLTTYYRTPYREVEVNLGGKYTSELFYSIRENTVEKGLHAYVNKSDIINLYNNNDACIVEATIPKGAQYYTGMFNNVPSIASSELVYSEVAEEF